MLLYLMRRLERLEPVLKGVLGLGAVVVLSRQRCVFAAYSPPKGVTGSAALAAARLFATANAPFAQSGQQICRKGDQFGIWWWDSAWTGEALATAGLRQPKPRHGADDPPWAGQKPQVAKPRLEARGPEPVALRMGFGQGGPVLGDLGHHAAIEVVDQRPRCRQVGCGGRCRRRVGSGR